VADADKGKPVEAPARGAADGGREPFFSRWTRLKEEARQPPSQKAPEKAVDPKAPAPELPPLD